MSSMEIAHLGEIDVAPEPFWFQSVAGVRSAAVLDEAGRRAVLEHLKSFGPEFRPAGKSGLRKNRPAPTPETERQVRKIRAMLAEDGLPDAYAEAILQWMCSH